MFGSEMEHVIEKITNQNVTMMVVIVVVILVLRTALKKAKLSNLVSLNAELLMVTNAFKRMQAALNVLIMANV